MDGTPMEINMLVEKKYPQIKELLEKVLNLQLKAKEESTKAFELIKFIKSMLEEYMNVMYVLTTLIPEDGENATIEQLRRRNKMLNLLKNYEIPWRPNIWLRMHQDSDKPKGNNVAGPLVVNMVEHYNSIRYNDNKGKRKHQGTKANPNKKYKVNCWKCGKPRHLKKDCKGGKVGNKANGSSTNGLVNDTSDSLKGQNMFNKCLQVYYVTYVFEAYFVQDDDVSWWVDSGATVHTGHVYFKRMQDMSKYRLFLAFDKDTENDLCDSHATPSLGNKKYFVSFIDDASRNYEKWKRGGVEVRKINNMGLDRVGRGDKGLGGGNGRERGKGAKLKGRSGETEDINLVIKEMRSEERGDTGGFDEKGDKNVVKATQDKEEGRSMGKRRWPRTRRIKYWERVDRKEVRRVMWKEEY
ncbi:zinc finger, CCHC-type containing protein [Tanacetum coccineum]